MALYNLKENDKKKLLLPKRKRTNRGISVQLHTVIVSALNELSDKLLALETLTLE